MELIEAGTPGLNLLDLWDGADRVIIVDAVKSGAAPGTVHSFDASLLPPRDVMPVSSHGMNVIDAVELGRLLGRLPAQLTIIGVEILSEEPFHVGLTPEVEAAVPRARERVLEAITQHRADKKYNPALIKYLAGLYSFLLRYTCGNWQSSHYISLYISLSVQALFSLTIKQGDQGHQQGNEK